MRPRLGNLVAVVGRREGICRRGPGKTKSRTHLFILDRKWGNNSHNTRDKRLTIGSEKEQGKNAINVLCLSFPTCERTGAGIFSAHLKPDCLLQIIKNTSHYTKGTVGRARL